MRFTGRVVDGRIELENAESLPEGALVQVTISDPEGRYELTAEEEEELWQANLEAERGEVISAEEFLAQLRSDREQK